MIRVSVDTKHIAVSLLTFVSDVTDNKVLNWISLMLLIVCG